MRTETTYVNHRGQIYAIDNQVGLRDLTGGERFTMNVGAGATLLGITAICLLSIPVLLAYKVARIPAKIALTLSGSVDWDPPTKGKAISDEGKIEKATGGLILTGVGVAGLTFLLGTPTVMAATTAITSAASVTIMNILAATGIAAAASTVAAAAPIVLIGAGVVASGLAIVAGLALIGSSINDGNAQQPRYI